MVNPNEVTKVFSNNPILGIMGVKGSGKDTVCRMIAELSPLRVYRFAFADHLKRILVKDFNLSELVLHGTQEEKDNTFTDLKWSDPIFQEVHRGRTGVLTYREAMTAVGEAYGTSFFVKLLMSDIYKFQAYNPDHLIVVTDVRFHKEYWTLTRLGASFLKVLGKPSGPGTDHPSENLKEAAHVTIPGKGHATLDETRERLIDALWSMFGIEVKRKQPVELTSVDSKSRQLDSLGKI